MKYSKPGVIKYHEMFENVIRLKHCAINPFDIVNPGDCYEKSIDRCLAIVYR